MGDDVTHFLKSGAKLLPMRPLYHPFVFRAKMSSGELFKEYKAVAGAECNTVTGVRQVPRDACPSVLS